MSTQRQKKLAPKVIENLQKDKPEPIGKVLKSVGYGEGLQNSPKRVLESEGFIEELAKLGFDPDNAKRVVGEILNTGEDPNRLKAADMIFKVNGSYAPDKSINVNVSVIDDEAISKIADELNSKMLNVHQGTSERSNGEVSGSMAQEVRDENGEGNNA